jgi:hypothetical protein
VNLTSDYSALWKTVVEAADYREMLAKRVTPRWFR